MTDRTDGLTTEYDVSPMRDPDFSDPNDANAIRADIRETRERMSHTVENIGARLNPDRLKAELRSTIDEKKAEIKSNIHDATIGKAEQMARVAYDRVEETRHGIMDNIRENPVPAAMVGIGLGWLLLSGRKNEDRVVRHVEYDRFSGPAYDRYAGSDSRYYTPIYDDGNSSGGLSGRAEAATDRLSDLSETARDRAEELTHRAQERVSGMAGGARETLHNVTDRAHEVLGSTASRAQEVLGSTTNRARSFAGEFAADTRHRTHRVEDRFDEALHESPLAVGAAAVALGLAIGLSAPSTRRESELMGARRDELFNRAREAAGGVTERVQEVATKVVDQAQETIRDAASSSGGSTGSSTTSAYGATGYGSSTSSSSDLL